MFRSVISRDHRTGGSGCGGAGGAGGTNAQSPSGSGSGGRSGRGTTSANATAHTSPGTAYTTRIACHESGPSHESGSSNCPVTYCDRATPPAMQHASTPDANACSVRGNVAPIAFAAHTKMPACATPITPHSAHSPLNPVAAPVAAVSDDHSTAKRISADLLPSRSATHPAGSWNAAYPAYHASHTRPMSCGVIPNSPSICFDGTPSADRWR